MDFQSFINFARETFPSLTPEQEAQFAALDGLYRDWNARINVISRKDIDHLYDHHVLHSLSIARYLQLRPDLEAAFAGASVLDLGTGGGYPGLPLAMACPDKDFVLVDSVGKKLKVIDAICLELGISNVSTVHGRAEDLAFEPAYREGFDLVTSRAVASLPVLCEYCLPFVKKGGWLAAYKTEAAAEEIDAGRRALKILGGGAAETAKDGIEGSGHIFVFIQKISPTPKAYPRKAGTPVKQPL